MPVYEYRCNVCGKTFETLQKFSDSPIEKCIFCSGDVAKIISPCSFHLKGTGWYVTDYARKSSSSSTSNRKNGSSSNEEKASQSSEKPKSVED